ncbi:hypothetical protein PoB_000832000 [Plakobranchus ocellatus]|uniref:ZSWIM1/3 RNaseH-like domain-containing protein n=1 Tax=Plakobranchus ocellatus TaxID=259542 RepID=A0AAV3YFH6_9GAST|nr:hypothetical protein PoB_000832000 [Plakobranchus ocellatus]
MVELIDSIEHLQQHGQVKVVVSDNGSGNVLDILAFSTYHCGGPLQQISRSTYKTCGRGRTVFYAFVRQETANILKTMFAIFVDFMVDANKNISFAMTDKDPNKINALCIPCAQSIDGQDTETAIFQRGDGPPATTGLCPCHHK